MILKIPLRGKDGVPKTLLEQKHRLNFLYFPQNTVMLTESREEFSDLHSIFRLRALRYSQRSNFFVLGVRTRLTCKVIWPTTCRDHHCFSNIVIDWSLRVCLGWKSINNGVLTGVFFARALMYRTGPANPPVLQAIKVGRLPS